MSRFPVLETLHLNVQDVHVEVFTCLLESTAPTGTTEAEKVPFFNVKELTIANMQDLSIEEFEALLSNAFPGLETLYLAGIFDNYKMAAIFTGTARELGRFLDVTLTWTRCQQRL